jgi:hypothetical protein
MKIRALESNQDEQKGPWMLCTATPKELLMGQNVLVIYLTDPNLRFYFFLPVQIKIFLN